MRKYDVDLKLYPIDVPFLIKCANAGNEKQFLMRERKKKMSEWCELRRAEP